MTSAEPAESLDHAARAAAGCARALGELAVAAAAARIESTNESL